MFSFLLRRQQSPPPSSNRSLWDLLRAPFIRTPDVSVTMPLYDERVRAFARSPATVTAAVVNHATSKAFELLLHHSRSRLNNFADFRNLSFQLFSVLSGFTSISFQKQILDYLKKEDLFSFAMGLGLALVIVHIIWLVDLLMEDKGRKCLLRNFVTMIFDAVISSTFAWFFGWEYGVGIILVWLLTFAYIIYECGAQIRAALTDTAVTTRTAASDAIHSVLQLTEDNFHEVRVVSFQMFLALGGFIGLKLQQPLIDHFCLLVVLGLEVVGVHIFWLLCLLMEDRGNSCILKSTATMVLNGIISSLFAQLFDVECYRGLVVIWFLTFAFILIKRSKKMSEAVRIRKTT